MSTAGYAASLAERLSSWKLVTDNVTVLKWVSGIAIPFISKPYQNHRPIVQINPKDISLYKTAIEELINIGAVVTVLDAVDQYFSPFFLVKKPSGKYRFILNLKRLNLCIEAPHFKLEDYRLVKKLMFRNCFFTSIDLKDAYFLLPIQEEDRKFLCFSFQSKTYQFRCLPFGLNIGPYVFTKLLKPVLELFRRNGLLCVAYLDDILFLGRSERECNSNARKAVAILTNLGFKINHEKSVLNATQRIKFLGFLFDSSAMQMSLTQDKKDRIRLQTLKLRSRSYCKIREFARIVGTLVAACPAVPYGWLHLKRLETEKFRYLKLNYNNYNRYMTVSQKLNADFNWWIDNINNSKQAVKDIPFDLEIFTDASTTGWGAYCNGVRTNGFWTQAEIQHHINYLELLAVFYGLRSFATRQSYLRRILLRVDNMTAIACINKMGSIQFSKLNHITRDIWIWCEDNNIVVFASYISSSDNFEADVLSRSRSIETEYELRNDSFLEISSRLGQPEIDLFATHINKKCNIYVSWRPDPGSLCVDAFTLHWGHYFSYIFAPFALIPRVLDKIIEDRATAIVVVPNWPSQPWFPLFRKLLGDEVIIFPPNERLLLSPFRKPHPLHRRLSLVAGKLCGWLF